MEINKPSVKERPYLLSFLKYPFLRCQIGVCPCKKRDWRHLLKVGVLYWGYPFSNDNDDDAEYRLLYLVIDWWMGGWRGGNKPLEATFALMLVFQKYMA